MTDNHVYLNTIATARPEFDFQPTFMELMQQALSREHWKTFSRLASRTGIEHRYTCLSPVDDKNFYSASAIFPSTEERMVLYQKYAPKLAIEAVRPLIADSYKRITHVIVGSCTGFYSPGIDSDLIREFDLRTTVKRLMVGFMGCYAAMQTLQVAHDIVRANPNHVVLIVNVELSSLHLQEPLSVEDALGFAQFADGAAAAIVSSEHRGIRIDSFHSEIFPEYAPMITWTITDEGFKMYLDVTVSKVLEEILSKTHLDVLLRSPNIDLYAIHPGGRSILDAVERQLKMHPRDMRYSRAVLQRYGNMSSATILFVLQGILYDPEARGIGRALAFGPGLGVEAMSFYKPTTAPLG